MSVGYEYEDFSGHPWCRDPARDEAVRASADGRPGPLPTLEEAIAAVTERRPPEPGGGGNVTPAASGAAGTEVVAWGVMVNGKIDTHAGSDALFTDKEEADEWCHDAALSNRGTVVPLYAAPQPAKGWLTAEERGSIQHAANLAKASWSYSVAQELENILAREKPPEVLLPVSWREAAGDVMSADEVRAALASAGVTVKEVG